MNQKFCFKLLLLTLISLNFIKLQAGQGCSKSCTTAEITLHTAVVKYSHSRDTHILKCIIQNNLSLIDSIDNKGRTPLHLAAKKNKYISVFYLLEYGANPNIKNNKNQTPLHLAAEKNKYFSVFYLLEYGANPNIKNNKNQTPLHLAAKIGCPSSIFNLLKKNADPDLKDNKGQTPLRHAITKGHKKAARILISHSADFIY